MPDTSEPATISRDGLRSMTGFAPITVAFDGWRVTGDIRSVNGRGLDLRLRVPDWIDGLEAALRKRVQAAVGRGSITLSLRMQRDDAEASSAINSEGLRTALSMLSEIEAAADAQGLSLAKPTAVDVVNMRGVMETGDDSDIDTKLFHRAVTAAMDDALAVFDGDRAREGAALAAVLGEQIASIEALVAQARDALGDRKAAAREAMQRALSRVMEATDTIDEARIAQELALHAVKSDVAEELDRLDTHVAAARELILASGPVGRKLDFLMQEFNREANTLCSKAQSSALTAIGLELKAVVDQMREQVQNIE